MSNINPIIELDKITSVSLNSSSYGKDINERFESIDKNFKKILETDYLVGAKGDSVGLMECKLSGIIADNTQYDLYDYNDVQITSTMLYDLIIDQIEYLYKDNGAALTSINNINWFDDLHGSTLYVLYENRDERKYLISSLPFTYIDSRYRKLNNDPLYEDTMDISCTLHYQTYSKEGSIVGTFQIIHPYPTIYYNKDIKDFCWSINGQETDLVCKGLSGKDGENGQLHIAYIDKDSTDNLHNILCVLGFDNLKKEYVYIVPNDFAKYGISIKDGDTIICFYAKKNDNGYELLPNINEDTSETSYFLTKTIIVPGTQTCQVYINEDTCTITTKLDMVTMFGLFDKIGLVDGCPKGLYIPYGKGEDRISGHMIWHTDGNYGPRLNIGPVKDVHNDNLEIIDQGSTLNIQYTGVIVNGSLEAQELYTTGPLTVEGGATLEGGVIIDGDVEIKENLIIDGDVEIKGHKGISSETISCREITSSDIAKFKNVDIDTASFNNLYLLPYHASPDDGVAKMDVALVLQDIWDELKEIKELNNFYNQFYNSYQKYTGSPSETIISNLSTHKHIVTGFYDGDSGNDKYKFDHSAIVTFFKTKNYLMDITYIFTNKSGSPCELIIGSPMENIVVQNNQEVQFRYSRNSSQGDPIFQGYTIV